VVRALPSGDFDVRDGAFDVAIVPDLGVVREPEALLARIRRLLKSGGSALIGARAASHSEESAEYYELYDRVALQFPHVRMIAEVPFTGVALADLSLEGDAPEVTVDTQLEGDRAPPERFFALGSQDDVRLAEYAIVALPRGRGATRDDIEKRSSVRAVLAEAQLRATVLEAQIDELKAKVQRQAEGAQLAVRLEELQARLREADARAAEHYLRAERSVGESREAAMEVARQENRVAQLEASLAIAEATVLALQGRVAERDDRLAIYDARLSEALEARERAEARADAAATELARSDAAEARAATLAAEIADASEGHAAELAELEGTLRERARVVRELEQEVVRRERIVQELLASIEDSRLEQTRGTEGSGAGSRASARDLDVARMDLAAALREVESRDAALRVASERETTLATVNENLRGRLDALAADVARRESERQDVVWRVGELEQQISRLEAEHAERVPVAPRAPAEGTPAAAAHEEEANALLQVEIDALRQAMAQEHEARVRAESGEELKAARTELARQAVLLEQLSRELEARDRTRTGESRGLAPTEA